MKKLSELEGSVLGAIWRDGPLTAYALRTQFERSPTSWFSGSAGAIYPLVKRLERRDLIRARARRADARATRTLELTPAGLAALRAWIGPEVEPWMASVMLDPIRTRLQFIGALPPSQRERLLAAAEPALEAQAAELAKRRDGDRRDGPVETWMATEGALMMTRARLRWVRWARRVGLESE